MTLEAQTAHQEFHIHKTSSITEQIEKIETSAQSHTLMLLQKKIHARKWEGIKPRAHDQLLFNLDKTRRIERTATEEKRVAEQVDHNLTFNPELNKTSRKIVEGRSGEFHSRIMNWENKRQEKLESQTRQKKEETEKNESKSVEPKNGLKTNVKESLVKVFVDSLGQISEQKKTQRLFYSKNNNNLATTDFKSKEDRSVCSKSAQIKRKRVEKSVKREVNEANAQTTKLPLKKTGKDFLKSEIVDAKLNFPTFKGIIKSELHA